MGSTPKLRFNVPDHQDRGTSRPPNDSEYHMLSSHCKSEWRFRRHICGCLAPIAEIAPGVIWLAFVLFSSLLIFDCTWPLKSRVRRIASVIDMNCHFSDQGE